jgi:hypothetical protein
LRRPKQLMIEVVEPEEDEDFSYYTAGFDQ